METFFTYDGLGSTADLTDDTATVTDTYSYDVFGDATHIGSSSNYWTFTGEQKDGSEDLYFLRARYYDPATGRFLTKDPVQGFALTQQPQNPYPYALNNPVNRVDPTGLASEFSSQPSQCDYGQLAAALFVLSLGAILAVTGAYLFAAGTYLSATAAVAILDLGLVIELPGLYVLFTSGCVDVD